MRSQSILFVLMKLLLQLHPAAYLQIAIYKRKTSIIKISRKLLQKLGCRLEFKLTFKRKLKKFLSYFASRILKYKGKLQHTKKNIKMRPAKLNLSPLKKQLYLYFRLQDYLKLTQLEVSSPKTNN